MATSFTPTAQPAASAAPAQRRRYLFGPVVDFLTFGGLSLLVFPLLLLLPQNERMVAQIAALGLWASHVLNNPHFAHSYQLFYRQFAEKASGRLFNPVMRARYLFAGVAVPVLLIGYLGWGFATANRQWLGYAGNAMALFVGWHYVKQGYGLLMTDCALKRQFFNAFDKRVLLVNCYAIWVAMWLLLNISTERTDLKGLGYYAFGFPDWLIKIGMAAAFATTLAAGAVFVRAWRSAGRLPLNGTLAYVASLYPWMILVAFNTYWVLLAPAFHSLQYLAVVWRFETNRESAEAGEANPDRPRTIRGHVISFALTGVALGALGFWVLPWLADTGLHYDRIATGPTFFAFAAWVFINVHHYFIDNVIWRRDNPETQRFLFS